ncbi:hypothetical protein [Lautropia mirabilis]|jgi:hypothetical protein
MFDDFAMGDLKAQIHQHLLMVEEVLGGMDLHLRLLDRRLERVEELLGVRPEGIAASGCIADVQRAKDELLRIRELFRQLWETQVRRIEG